MNAKDVLQKTQNKADPELAEKAKRFFKTNKGDYSEKTIFLGIRVPYLRQLAKDATGITLEETLKVLKSKYHEDRMCALFILINLFNKSDIPTKGIIYKMYLSHTKYINNWDLVDCSAYKIVGEYLLDKDTHDLEELVLSKNLWERRIAIVSMFQFIRKNQFELTLKFSEILLKDKEDLIHKATGWMLRELGKRNLKLLKNFINKHNQTMPRTMLRYAIEKFPQQDRKTILKGLIVT